jgi:hypothetical protein
MATVDRGLRPATNYDVDGDARVLLDERGEVVARLLPGGRPTPGPDILPAVEMIKHS